MAVPSASPSVVMVAGPAETVRFSNKDVSLTALKS
jgi:hypothetical protein